MSELVKENNEPMLSCGCGKPVRYIIKGEGSCNKYRRCATYEELCDRLNQAERKLIDIKKILKD